MQKWEYRRLNVEYSKLTIGTSEEPGAPLLIVANDGIIFHQAKMKELFEYLDELGSRGWELVSTNSWKDKYLIENYYFKRPIQE